GYPEATFTFAVARALRKRLSALGAKVVMTRTRNSRKLWGPCVDVRGRAGNAHTLGLQGPADAKISLHGDGASADGHGFHVIAPVRHRTHAESARLGKATRSALRRGGFARASYVAGGTGLVYRGDLATLNLSRVPAVMVELGNMRNAHDARVMRSKKGRQRYAEALQRGLRAFLSR
ncbi:MAG: N-acetylmuramoyl-L-alanine amidase family protein, partial [Nocardioidaceae bacterium]